MVLDANLVGRAFQDRRPSKVGNKNSTGCWPHQSVYESAVKHTLMPSLVLLVISSAAAASNVADVSSRAGFEIHLAGVNEREKIVAEELIALAEMHDLSPWLFTGQVRIESGVIPHSHPTLTLNTRHFGNPNQLLAVFLHEQIHRFLATPENRTQLEGAIGDLRAMYPEVPDARSGGAANEYSTYLHLLVNWLEFDALSGLLGPTEAQQVLEHKDIYEWIYSKVLTDTSELEGVVARHGLLVTN